jgi:DNA polymerase III alpha subunit
MDFAHLHVHSYFSLLDGAASPDELVQAAWDASMSAVALTDHNSLAGAVRFYQAAIEVGVKPIIGVEFDVGTAGNSGAHLVLLAEDNEGYANLCRLVTAARLGEARRESAFSDKYAEVDRDRPLLSQEHLREHCSHLIALSGCQQRGEIPALLRRKRFREAHEVAGYYRDLFGSDRFFIELHNHLLPRPDNRMRSLLADLAGRLDLPVVATNNVHYARRSSYRLQDVLVCIRNHKTVEEPHPDRKPRVLPQEPATNGPSLSQPARGYRERRAHRRALQLVAGPGDVSFPALRSRNGNGKGRPQRRRERRRTARLSPLPLRAGGAAALRKRDGRGPPAAGT